jgi:exopolysaccharide biosynthesis polyprenyl glycosylphosphotransferase
MRNRAKFWLALLTVGVDALMAIIAFYLAYKARVIVPFPTPLKLGRFLNYVDLLFVHVSSVLLTFFFFRLYHLGRGTSRFDLFYSVLSAVSIATVVGTAVTYLIRQSDRELTRGVTLYSWALTTALVSLGRIVTERVRGRVQKKHPDRLLLVGTGDVARMILQKTLQSPQLGYKVVGFVGRPNGGGEVAGVPVLGSQAQLAEIVRQQQVEEVVIALPEASHEELLDMITACEGVHATVRIFPDLFQIIASELSIGDLDGLPMLTVRDVALRGWRLAVKRTMDIVGSACALIVLSPFLLFIALLVKLDSKGPVFYMQERVGLDGKPFPIIKFRSMRLDAEQGSGPVWATADDPRKTRLGTFLRKSSIDELPQFINVLLGDMSLVGPRPERPVFVEEFKKIVPRYMERHKEKAGLTGWAQVHGLRGDTSIVERTKYDLYYIENWSLLFDLKIILRQILSWFHGDRNAY